jgi:hypothetical protein
MAHGFARALQQASWVWQRCAMKKPNVDVRSEHVDVAEGRIAQACNRTAIMQDLPDFIPTFSHHFEPLMRDGAHFTSMLIQPRIDGGIAFDSTVESQEFLFHPCVSFRVQVLRGAYA